MLNQILHLPGGPVTDVTEITSYTIQSKEESDYILQVQQSNKKQKATVFRNKTKVFRLKPKHAIFKNTNR